MKSTAQNPQHTRGRAIRSGAFAVVLLAVLALAAAVAVVPRVLGGSALTVLTGSMEPTYAPGDMVISAPADRYRIGDVVTFQPVSDDPTLITHRIVAVSQGADGPEYVTRGDANGNDDEPIVEAQVMGSVRYHIPYLGHVSMLAGEHRGTIIIIAGAALIGYGVFATASALLQQRPSRGRHRLHTRRITC